ncbi:MAG: 50S ribosomal protein L29 [Candidatus Omnitrophica bacterium]|nr:50S ribosomal protein L29 [Candidatus Omnitrophota bacterium]
MKVSELRNLNKEELLIRLKDLRKKLMELNFQKSTGNIEKPHLFKQIKRDIARILTIINTKEKNSE